MAFPRSLPLTIHLRRGGVVFLCTKLSFSSGKAPENNARIKQELMCSSWVFGSGFFFRPSNRSSKVVRQRRVKSSGMLNCPRNTPRTRALSGRSGNQPRHRHAAVGDVISSPAATLRSRRDVRLRFVGVDCFSCPHTRLSYWTKSTGALSISLPPLFIAATAASFSCASHGQGKRKPHCSFRIRRFSAYHHSWRIFVVVAYFSTWTACWWIPLAAVARVWRGGRASRVRSRRSSKKSPWAASITTIRELLPDSDHAAENREVEHARSPT